MTKCHLCFPDEQDIIRDQRVGCGLDMAKQLVMPSSLISTYLSTQILQILQIWTGQCDAVLAPRKIDVAINKICKSELSSISKWIVAAERTNLASLIIIFKIKSSNYFMTRRSSCCRDTTEQNHKFYELLRHNTTH